MYCELNIQLMVSCSEKNLGIRIEVKLRPIDKQIEILNELARIILQSAANYDCLACRFDVDVKSESVGQEFSFVRDGKTISALLNDPNWAVMNLVFDLHKEMKAHTGGEWIAFTLTIGEDGKAKTHFEYPET
jgi:hypothetical protein